MAEWHRSRGAEQPTHYFVDSEILKNYNSKNLRSKLQRLWHFSENNWEKPGFIKVKPKKSYYTSRSSDVGRQSRVSEPQRETVLTRKWAELRERCEWQRECADGGPEVQRTQWKLSGRWKTGLGWKTQGTSRGSAST